MIITGKIVKLRPAVISDRQNVFLWLTRSDLTSSMLGPPDYPEHPVPSWEEFIDDYKLHFFDSSGDGKGRNFIIIVDNQEAGVIGYDLLDKEKDRVVLDIWMAGEKYCGKGYGSDAINILCNYIHETYSITSFLISPSARNKRAIAVYSRCGFKYVSIITREDQEREFGLSEYDDNVIMIKTIESSRADE